ncbi:unnamed protein product [Protopolystoma xenopodis]|uniref:Uncharacterized protein n=1 Tax=Protopolystoma xenopodis TaxID=117903 RepID=A0A3S4ZTG5_9PLAT|nr:unnamed protein product [Protopolystoma xenopodis]
MAYFSPEVLRKQGEIRYPPYEPVIPSMARTSSDIARNQNRSYLIRNELCAKPIPPPADYIDVWGIKCQMPEIQIKNKEAHP